MLALPIAKTIVINHLRNEIKRAKILTRAKVLHKAKSPMFRSLR